LFFLRFLFISRHKHLLQVMLNDLSNH